tara:strand:+ start:4157 stop:5755 length:1599 start_codon:yes stop_codon:yes gene_type:complete
MRTNLIVEINRNREIMGLERLLTEEEKTEKANELIDELIEVFKSTPKEEREELKNTILKGLKDNGTDDETIQDANNKMDEFMGLEEVIVDENGEGEEDLEEQIKISNPFGGSRVGSSSSSSQNAYSGYKQRRRSKCSGAYNTYQKALCLLQKLIKLPTGIEIWASTQENYINIPIRKGRAAKNATLDSLTPSQPDTKKEDWQKYFDKYNKKFVKRIKTKKGKGIWASHWDVEEGKYKPFMIDVLEEFNEFRKNKGKPVVRVNDKPKTTIKEGEIIEAPIVKLQFPVDGQPDAQYFVDNCYKVLPAFVDQIDLLIAKVVESAQGKEVPSGKKQFWLDSLEIVSSCSAVPNGKTCGKTTLSKAMTFPELAEARANAAKEYLMEKLKGINCGIGVYNEAGDETKITINSKGENSDGTSGPAWDPAYAKYIKPWKDSEQTDTGGGPKINAIFQKYEKAKKCTMGLGILVNTQDKGEETKEPDEIILTDKMAVTMNIPGRSPKDLGFGWRWPKIRWRPFTTLSRFFNNLSKKNTCWF